MNVGLPDIDEPALMEEVVQELQSVVNIPLQIDTVDEKSDGKSASYFTTERQWLIRKRKERVNGKSVSSCQKNTAELLSV